MRGRARLLAAAGLAGLCIAFGTAFGPPPQGPAAAPAGRGLQVTFEPGDETRRQKEGSQTSRARLLALDVERGESPTSLLSAGMFKATFRGRLQLAVRDRFKFQVVGRGDVELVVNGEKVLGGTLRASKPLETAEPVKLKKGDNDVVCTIESSVQGEAALRVLWSGPDFAFEPIAPESWLLPAGDGAALAAGEQLRRGHQVFVERRCARCHRPQRPLGESAEGELDLPGPDLRAVGARLQPGWFQAWLADPRALRPDARMPKLAFAGAEDVADLAAALAGTGTPAADPAGKPEDVEAGGERFLQLGCIACHVLGDQDPGGTALGDRTSLAFVPRKWRLAALVDFLREPGRDHPGTRMPDFKLSPADAQVLAAKLLAGKVEPLPAPKGDATRGKHLLQKYACARCHAVDVPEDGVHALDLRNLHVDHGCLAGDGRGDGKSPDHALRADELAALRAFLPHAEQACFQRAPIDYAARAVTAWRCTSCHGRDSAASVWAEVARKSMESEPLLPDKDPIAQGVPALTWVGAKLQPGWIERFVTGTEKSPRPWLHARMPAFARHGAAIAAGLVREQGFGPQDEVATAPDAQLVGTGQRLVKMGEGFGCVQCHGVAGQPPVQVFERQGIDFQVAARRLRHEYYLRWLLDPVRIDPDARMPKFADAKGRTAFTDVLGGDARAQFEAIWQYFRSLAQ